MSRAWACLVWDREGSGGRERVGEWKDFVVENSLEKESHRRGFCLITNIKQMDAKRLENKLH